MTNAGTVLRGLAWDHARGWGPMALTSQVFSDHHRNVRIEWERQSLWAFGEGGIDQLAAACDLVVIDHPMTGLIARSGLFRPFLASDVVPAVGGSAESYRWDGTQWALPIDAACQVSVRRDDLLAAAGEPAPRTWAEVLSLARRTRRVLMPMTPIDVLSSLLTLTAAGGVPAGTTVDGLLLDRGCALRALELLREMRAAVPASCASTDPIGTLEAMSLDDQGWYCPLVFGYSNYSRDGYAEHRLSFGELPRIDAGQAARGALLGGAGIAVTATGTDPEMAAEYARWVASNPVQRGDFVRGAGQPAAVAAWDDEDANRITHGFFRATRSTIDAASLRSRDPEYPAFQSEAAEQVHRWLADGDDPLVLIEAIERSYQAHGLHERLRASAGIRS